MTDQTTIDVIVAMKELRPGDEVRIKNAVDYNITRSYEGRAVKVNIAAWRRLNGKA